MTLRKTRTSRRSDDYEIWDSSRVVRMVHDKEVGAVTVTAWVNNGSTVCRSRSFKTVSGAERWGRRWLEGMQ